MCPASRRAWHVVVMACASAVVAACKQTELSDQPRSGPLDRSTFFADERSARTPVPGTIPRGGLRIDQHLYEGMREGAPAAEFPFELERGDLERGRDRYDVYCAPCHGYVGDGDGMVVQRGFPRPPSLHSLRLRDVPVGYVFQVITRGAAAMPSYRSQIEPRDRWRIVGYVRALQRSQHARRDDVPAGEWAALLGGDDGPH